MPTLYEGSSYRFYYFSHHSEHRPYICVDRGQLTARFWLSPIALDYNIGFSRHELRMLEAIIGQHEDEYVEKWNGYFIAAIR